MKPLQYLAGSFRLPRAVVAVLCLLLTGLAAAPSHATVPSTINVPDGDVAALILAINTANTDGNDDIINLAAGGTYSLTAVDNVSTGPNGLPVILADGTVTINGNGATITRVGGSPDFRLFMVATGATVNFSQLTLSNGTAPSTSGGGAAVYNKGGTVGFDTCTITGNTALGEGAAIYSEGAFGSVSTILTNCQLTNNTSTSGTAGALYTDGFDGTTITTLTGCTVSGNTAPQQAGALYNDGDTGGDSTMTLSHCNIHDNSSNGNCGAVYDDGTSGSATLNIDNSTFTSNISGDHGGALFCDGSNGTISVTITTSTFTTNSTAGNFGGAIYDASNSGTASVSLTDCTLSGNSAQAGGAIYNDGSVSNGATLTLTNCTLNNNTGEDAQGGGAIYNDGTGFGDSTASLTNCTLVGNSAGTFSGGAIYNDGFGGEVLLGLTNCTFSGNTASTDDGVFSDGTTGSAGVITVNTIFATGGTEPSLVDNNSNGSITSQGHNLSTDGGGGFLTATGDQINVASPGLDSALRDNGGPTFTLALLPNSPALDAGDNGFAPATDQRGVTRPQPVGGTSDIGAVEERQLGVSGLVRTSGLTPIAGVSVSLAPTTGGTPSTTTTDASGAYSFTNVPEGLYNVTPSLAGFTFAPALQGLRVSTANRAANFIGASSNPVFSVTGRVSDGGGAALAGVSVVLSITGGGTLPAGINSPTLTNSAGYYTITGVPNGSYSITPTSGATVFTPPSHAVVVSGANPAAQNFIGNTGFSISGRAADPTGLSLANVSVALTVTGGGPLPAGVASPVVTNSAGYYTFNSVPNGDYTITPTEAGFTFSPASLAVTVAGANLTAQNFTGTTGFAVSGRISTSGGVGITGVLVSADSGQAATSNSAGYYTIFNVPNGSRTLTPSKAGLTFTPATKTLTVSGAAVSGQNFIGM